MNTSDTSGGFYHVIDGIARLILVALFALLPLFIIPVPWAAVAQGKMLLVVILGGIALLAWTVARLLEGGIHVPRSALLYATALLPFAYLISTAAAGWTGAAIVGQGIEQDTLTAIVVWFSIFALTAFLLYGNLAAQKLSMQALVIGLTILTAFQTLYLFFPSWFSLSVLSGTTANIVGSWHDLGILSGLGLFLALALFQSGYFTGIKRLLLLALGMLSSFLLVVIHFQDVFWATGALTLVGGVIATRSALKRGANVQNALLWGLPWILATILLGGGAYFGTQLWEKLPARISISQTEVRPSWQGTFDIAKQSLQAPSEFVFGAGPNSFIREWGLHKPSSVNTTPFWDSDFNFGVGIIPTSIFTAGFFGLLAWSALILVLLGLSMRLLRDSHAFSSDKVLFALSLMSSAYLIVYHMIYTPGVAVTGTLFVLLGLVVVSSVEQGSARSLRVGMHSIKGAVRLAVLAGVVACAVIALLIVAREIASNMLINRAAFVYQEKSSVEASSALINKALSLSPKNDRAHRAAAELGVIQLAQIMAETKADDAQSRAQLQAALQTTIQHGLTAVSIDESSYQNWLLLAQVYSDLAGAQVEGSFSAAQNAYEKAYAANPTNPVPKLRLAQLYALQGNREAARTNLTDAIALKPDFAAAHYLLSQIEFSDGKGEAAVAAAANAAQLVPSDPLGWFNLGYILYAGQAYRDAALSLQQAVSLAPDYSNALFYLGLSYNALQMPNEAIVALQKVLELNPNETVLSVIMQNIREGKDPSSGLSQ